MDILVEIGSEQQKEQVRKELELVQSVYSSFKLQIPLQKIIIPEDFDATVNALQDSKDYCSRREEHIAVAKNIIKADGIFLVFSKDLFTKLHDNFTRLQMYLHELLHAYNVHRKPELRKESLCEYQYLLNLYILFDEYYANRKSFEIIAELFPKTSFRYKRNNYCHLKGFIKAINADNVCHKNLCSKINEFRSHGNIDTFLKSLNPLFAQISKSIVYIYSYIDCTNKGTKFEPLILKSKFVNEKTLKLIKFFRFKYGNNNFDLFDGKLLMEDFMKNFGMQFEDTSNGLYCHVLDI
ncbi:MAG: hypothetical protein AABY84_13260 [Candidatus Firestonebacteria bacterium]